VEVTIQTAPKKPLFGEPCNGCGYCCTVQPCLLADEFLHCTIGPCIALETHDGRAICGLARNPLGYLFKAAHPQSSVPVLEAPSAVEMAKELSSNISSALGIGLGCDAADDEESACWPIGFSTGEPG
jgi:hypothetical protein